VAQHPFPAPGYDGDEPLPAGPERDWAADQDRYLAWLTAEIDAGRIEVPPEEDEPPPARAVPDLALLDDEELVGVMKAARRRQARDEYEELAAIAEYARRREEAYEASKARGDKPRRRDGEFAAEELGMELICSHYAAGHRMELADDLSRRLPATFAGMANGTIDGYRAKIIRDSTCFLSDEQAAQADAILAAAAPELAPAELKKKAARLEMRLDPDGVRQRKEEAARKHRRVEARQEASGNASLSGRELSVEEALTAKNSIWADAVKLHNAGLGTSLREARTTVYLDRLRNLNPWDRLVPPYDPPGGDDDPGSDGGGDFPDDYGYDEDEDQNDAEDEGDAEDDGNSGPSGQPGSPAGKAPLPALTNVTISAGTLLGWSDAPAEVAGFGLVDPGSARDLIAAASRHSRSRWCVTVLGKDGEAIAHGCASGRHPWIPTRNVRASPRDGTARAGPDDHQREQLAELLSQLRLSLAPIAKGTCDHKNRENRYRPSRKLQHLVRARTATCSAPGCTAQAIYTELDHTTAYPAGSTDQCNLSPLCARHRTLVAY
jgi:hypothetical protein